MAEEKKYCGSGKAIKTKYGEIINIGIKVSDFQSFINEKGWVNLSIGSKKETDKYGNSHAVWVNEFKPTPKDDGRSEQTEISEPTF